VSVLLQGEAQAVIGTGVEIGDRVVTVGFAQLADGKPVEIDVGEAAVQPRPAKGPKGERKRDGGGEGSERRRRNEQGAGDPPAGKGVATKEAAQ
jgi:multidrug efflux system membrane fusion protein